MTKKFLLNSHNEWDKLEQTIVGTAKNSTGCFYWSEKSKINEKKLLLARKLAQKAYPKWYVDEVEEDLNDLCKILKKFNVEVLRPDSTNVGKIFKTPNWNGITNNVYNARDLYLVAGNYLVESPSPIYNRYFEKDGFKNIFYKYLENGFTWINPPAPKLDYKIFNLLKNLKTREKISYKKLTKGLTEKLHKLSNQEILFESANTLRIGKDLLYLNSISGNTKGYEWLKNNLSPKYNVHQTKNLYKSSHIDSTIMCLKPGVVLLNSVRVSKKNCPKIFKKWKKIYHSDVAPVPDYELNFHNNIRKDMASKIRGLGFSNDIDSISSPWIGLNFLSLDKKNVIVDLRQKSLIKVLEKNKFNVIPCRMRHMYSMSGGIHCSTLDTKRKSKLESYI
jgi:N-dimethylarginine dimethylaminohydrolase